MIEAFVQEPLVILLVLVINTVLATAGRYNWVSNMVQRVENLVGWVCCPALCLAQCLVDTQ